MSIFQQRLQTLKQILVDTGYYRWLIVSVLFFVLAFFFREPPFYSIAAFIAGSILFTTYDVVGYTAVTEAYTSKLLMSYRIMQTTFQYTLFFFIFVAYSGQAAIAFLVFHWFGGDDVLYHWVGKYPLPPVWGWMNWTPLGLIFQKPLSKFVVLLQATVGMALAIVICVT